MNTLPQIGQALETEHLNFLKAFSKSCRKSIVQMVANAQSGHPGGSLSSLDFLATIYPFIISQTGEKVVVSNGHISPAVYSLLGEMRYIDKEDAIQNFRKFESKYEGHISRHVPGILYGTGPLGAGVSIGSAFALAEKLKKTDKKVFTLMGDGEVQEGQVHEMIQFSSHYKLNNLILFVDYNKVQLTDKMEDVQDIDVHKIFEAGGWHVIDLDAHNFSDLWAGIGEAYTINDKPVVIIGHTIMGKGVELLEKDGREYKSTWHGKPIKPEEAEDSMAQVNLTEEEAGLIKDFLPQIKWHPEKAQFPELLSDTGINEGSPTIYEEPEACRNAYGKALLDLAKNNPNILALSADLRTSVMTKYVAEELPEQHIEVGIAEQNMVSLSGGLSLCDYTPFCSTFGAFMSSRAKDQARLNDINNTNVKMVSSHCGLSVGEDGPTHQALDDSGSFLGMFNTMTIEPADPNHTDRIIRYIASHYGNFYVRYGRHNIAPLKKEDGSLFYDANYKYEYGKCDVLREGTDLTIAAMGSTVEMALEAHALLKEKGISAELVIVSSIKKFDDTLTESIKKTKKVVTVEDHNILSGLGSQLALHLERNGIKTDAYHPIGIPEYQLSGKPAQLYANVGLDAESIAKTCNSI